MKSYGLGMIEARTLMGEEGMVEYFETVVSKRRQVKSVISWTIHELLGRLHSRNINFTPEIVTAAQLGTLVDCVDQGLISAKVGKNVLNLMVEGDSRSASEIVEEKGWRQMDNQSELGQMCDTIMAQYPDKVKIVQKGNVGVLGFFVGQIMKESQGRANPVALSEILRDKMGLPSGAAADANSFTGKVDKKNKSK
ncbi:hypothetical protein BGZ75_006960 [Mortierella antarctica]|nr:hypothetical protein BGZ75_006960 [Mortierella antarctica]